MADPTPLDIAHSHGYTGEAAETFASLLHGDAAEQLVDAARLAALFAPAAAEEPPRPRATDPTQGQGPAESSPDQNADFASFLRSQLTRSSFYV